MTAEVFDDIFDFALFKLCFEGLKKIPGMNRKEAAYLAAWIATKEGP